ncbi:Uma2 family endonuclease [Actinacidiphila oryziradicis]|uniref:Uma2 family endonuclease n=1 Tax=Actinacidiphila oryziradicis TaxID=2571141 RepID=A0A4V5MX47_9ACTN|nr:Uma2 family endonuclease [Actinacidiphila oryziradicis]TJZ98798.1 Uma2 family endonuclease [Actinacidiphila oryziradicis]
MSALSVEHEPENGNGWDELVRFWEEMDWPEGCKVEIIEGIITVAPPPANDHNNTAELLQRLLYKVIPDDWGIYQTQGVSVPERQGLYIPDLAVMPRATLERPGHHVPLSEAELVVEITSRRNANHDRVEKLRGYATAEVPLYLLLDPWHSGRPTATLYGEPKGGMYHVLDNVKYGEEIHLPEPFDLTIDTGIFPGS